MADLELLHNYGIATYTTLSESSVREAGQPPSYHSDVAGLSAKLARVTSRSSESSIEPRSCRLDCNMST
jgi:hypothetical protein